MVGSVTKDKFFSRDRQIAFDEIKDIMYAEMKDAERDVEAYAKADNPWDRGFNSAKENHIAFIRRVIDMMERS